MPASAVIKIFITFSHFFLLKSCITRSLFVHSKQIINIPPKVATEDQTEHHGQSTHS